MQKQTTFKELEKKISHIVQQKLNGEYVEESRGSDYGDSRYKRNENTEPSTSIVLKGLAPTTTEDEIRSIVYRNYGLVAQNAKIARDKRTNESRGFGFLDFDNLESSKLLIDSCGGGLYIGQHFVYVEYSHKKNMHQQLQTAQVEEEQISTQEQLQHLAKQHQQQQDKSVTYKDWICEKCSLRNFSHRVKCFSCFSPRSIHATEVLAHKDGTEAGGSARPTVELIVRSLNSHTNEDTLYRVFNNMAAVKCVRIIRDKHTMASKQFGFVEFHTTTDCIRAMEKCTSLTIDGNVVNVTYARRQHLESSQPQDGSLAAWQSYYSYGQTSSEEDYQRKEQMDEIHTLLNQGYVYDETCGYYYNAALGYHYDTKTKYFYDNNSAQWLYYDVYTCNYIPVQQLQMQQQQQQEESKVAAAEEQQPVAVVTQSDVNATDKRDAESSTPPEEILISKPAVANPKYLNALKRAERKEEKAKEAEFASFLGEIDSLLNVPDSTSATTTTTTTTPSDVSDHVPVENSSTGNKKRKRELGDLNDDNIGNKLLKKLGWSEGQGLGKNNTGITAPINVQVRSAGLGLGFDSPVMSVEELAQKNARMAKGPGDRYKDMVYKTARERYK